MGARLLWVASRATLAALGLAAVLISGCGARSASAPPGCGEHPGSARCLVTQRVFHQSPGFAPLVVQHSQFRALEVQWRYACTATAARMAVTLAARRGPTGSGKELYYESRYGPAGWRERGTMRFRVAGAHYIFLSAGPLGITTAFPHCTTHLRVIGDR